MGYRITTDLFCDSCGHWIHGGVSDHVQKAKVRAEAKRQRWRRLYDYESRTYLFYCPECAEQAGPTPDIIPVHALGSIELNGRLVVMGCSTDH